MAKGFYNVPIAKNEPILSYAPGTKERKELKAELEKLRSLEVDIPMYIGGKEVKTDKKVRICPPHDINHT
ncbi:MAG: 1-pyrroline-5-carboxylate dehydrogenase, partial [Bacteroidetes bacterium]